MMFRPKKKYKLIERRVARPGPVLLVANQQLHTYNMRHNPDYRNNYIQDSAAHRLIGEVVQPRRRPLLGPSPG